jgi:hypothetical protein
MPGRVDLDFREKGRLNVDLGSEMGWARSLKKGGEIEPMMEGSQQ